MAEEKQKITLADGIKWTLILGTGVATAVVLNNVYKFLTDPDEKLIDLPFNADNFNFREGYTPEKEALLLYDLMKGVQATNYQFTGALTVFSNYNDDMMKATVNAWNNTIPNENKSLYTWIAAEWCDYWLGYDACKQARSRALQRLTQVGAVAKFKKR